ncbi:MAG: HEAT repeat domain-containing protein, partial [Nanoarchaeota archaeon]|nr:HEAT repeat domain-containing protein [Nanoarchaeota archaeon]
YFGKEELIYPEESKDIIVDAIEVDEVISEASVPHAVVEAHYENNLWGCNTYGNSDFSTCKNEVIKIHNGDEVRFDGSGSSFEGFPILESDMSWYRIYNEDDVSELRRLIESEANSLILRNFFDNIQLKNGGININLNEGVDVLIGRKSINIKFKFSSPFGFDSNTKETQYVALEVKDIFGDYSGYYIQEVSVGCFDNSRSCDANDVVAGISRGDVAETVLSSAEITELTFKTCNTDADCNRWMCSLGSCVPRNYEDLACKLSSGRGESVSYNGKTYNNPFYGNPLFKQIASASPATASECVAGDVSKVKIPICTENGVSFETKPCPSGTSCSEGVCVESECIDDYSSKTKDDCWNAKGLCVDGSGCVDFEDMGWPDEVLINVLELKTSSEVNVRRNAIYAIYALRKIGSEYAVPVLIKVLETDSDANVKRETIYALGKIGSEDAVPVLARVLETDTDSFVRKKVVNALGEIGSESVIPILENTLRNDPDQYVRIGAAESLEKIYLKYSTSDSAKGEIKQAFIRTLEIRTLEDYHDGTAEKTLVMILKKIGSEEILQILERLGYLQGGEISSFRISEKAKSIYNGGSPSTRYYELKANYKMMTGANPIGIIGDLANYPDFVNGLVTASEATGLSPEFIASSIEQEGLARLLKTTSFLNDYPVNTFSDIGMDTFVDDLPLIQSKYGLLNHIDYESLKDKSRVGNEVGLQVVVADINLKDAVLGIAGMLALRRDRLVQDMQEYNVNLNEFEQEWYIYLYYNLGASYGKEGGTKGGQWYLRNRRSQEVYIQSNRDLDKEFGETGNSNFHFNAGRVAGGSSLIKDLGIFEEDLLASF